MTINIGAKNTITNGTINDDEFINLIDKIPSVDLKDVSLEDWDKD